MPLVPTSKPEQRQRQPYRRMGVLSAVFPYSRQITPNIARVPLSFVKGRGKKLYDLVLPVKKMLHGRFHRPIRPFSVPQWAQDGKGLGDGVDAARLVRRGSQRLTVIIPASQEPVSIPGSVGGGGVPARLRLVTGPGFAAAERCESLQYQGQKPSEPHALPSSGGSHQVHAVVPISGPHLCKSMRSGPPAQGLFHRPPGMLQYPGLLRRSLRRLISFPLILRQGRGHEEGNRHLQNVPVPRFLQIFAQDIGQPQQIVTDSCAHTALRLALSGWVPPMLHVPLLILVGAGPEKLRPSQLRSGKKHRAHILQLIPEPVGPAVLVKRCPGEKTAGNHLIEGPTVEIAVQRLVRRPERQRAYAKTPPRPGLLQPLPRPVEIRRAGLRPTASRRRNRPQTEVPPNRPPLLLCSLQTIDHLSGPSLRLQ